MIAKGKVHRILIKRRLFRRAGLLPIGLLGALVFIVSGCSVAGPAADELNPFSEGNAVQPLGNRDASAINSATAGGGAEAENARHMLKALGSKQNAAPPQPYYPVVRPAEVRLMWVPDHLNRFGDLVPAHYYYLKVSGDQWELRDAFDNEMQMEHGTFPPSQAPIQGPTGQPGVAPVSAPAQYYQAPTNYGTQGGGSQGGATPWVYKEEGR